MQWNKGQLRRGHVAQLIWSAGVWLRTSDAVHRRTNAGVGKRQTAKNSVESDFQHFFSHSLNEQVCRFVSVVECTVEQEINTKMYLHIMVLSTSMYKKTPQEASKPFFFFP